MLEIEQSLEFHCRSGPGARSTDSIATAPPRAIERLERQAGSGLDVVYCCD